MHDPTEPPAERFFFTIFALVAMPFYLIRSGASPRRGEPNIAVGGARTPACRVETRLDACFEKISTLVQLLVQMPTTRRRLPHIYPKGVPLFVTWHLHGSVPHNLHPPGTLTSGEAFVWLDRHVDNPKQGPMYLQQPEFAKIVVASIHKGVELGHYELGAYVAMPNHVHLLVLPLVSERRNGSCCEPFARPHGGAVLAEGILRSLGAGSE